MDILGEIVENETEKIVLMEKFGEISTEIEEKPNDIDQDKLLEDEIRRHLMKKGEKMPHRKCSRCGNDLGSVDQWFNYGIKAVKFGYTMMPQPLCKSCFKDFEDFMKAFEVKK